MIKLLNIDTREPKNIINNCIKLCTENNIEYKIGALSIGDFVDYDLSLCFERKEIGDFISSFTSQRLQKQLIHMSENFKYSILIISGDFDKLFFKGYKRNINTNQYLGMLRSVSLRYNSIVIQVKNDNQLLQMIIGIIKDIKEGKVTEFTGEVKFVEKTLSNYIRIVSIIPGLSTKLAERIRITYPTIKNLIGALENDTFEVKGVGLNKTIALKNFFKDLELIN